jgi:hypothetical protein
MAPRKLTDAEAPQVLLDESEYTEALLFADENAKDLAEPLTKLRDACEETMKNQRAYWRAEVIAQAMVDRQNYLLDQDTFLFERALKRAIEDAGEANAPQSPRFKSYFREEPRRLRDRGLESQVAAMRGWPALLRLEPEAQLKSWAEIFEALFLKADEVLAGRRAAQAQTRTQRVQEILPLYTRANDVRQELHGELSKRAPQRSLGRDWPDTFFRTQDRREPLLLGELRRSLGALLEARGFTVTDEVKKKLEDQTQRETLVAYLIKAATAARIEDVV